jgi:hypothetical protein
LSGSLRLAKSGKNATRLVVRGIAVSSSVDRSALVDDNIIDRVRRPNPAAIPDIILKVPHLSLVRVP